MTLPDNWFREGARSNRSGEVRLSGRHLTTTNGTLSTAAGAQDSPGYTLTKVGGQAGRYLLQLVNNKGEPVTWLKLTGFNVWVETTGAMTAGRGGSASTHVRGAPTIATNGQLTIQLRQITGADAEVDDGAVIGIELALKRSSAVP